MFAEPASVQEIAQQLAVTEAAIKQHLLRLYDKFEIWEGTRRRVRLANEALRLAIVRLPGQIHDEKLREAADLLEAGRAASALRDWEPAFADLSAAAIRTPLGAGDLELLGEAGWFGDHHRESDQALERAHAVYIDVGDRSGAARTAVTIANRVFFPVFRHDSHEQPCVDPPTLVYDGEWALALAAAAWSAAVAFLAFRADRPWPAWASMISEAKASFIGTPFLASAKSTSQRSAKEIA